MRNQIELVPQSLEERVGDDHPARAIWALLERLDLARFYAKIRATVEGIGSARRMGTAEGQATYRQRGAIAEWTNAQLRARHGLQRLTVRGVDRVTSVVLLLAVTHNLLRYLSLTA